MLRRYLIAALFCIALVLPRSGVLADGFREGVQAYADGDIESAIAHWREAADGGNDGAALLLANLYSTGQHGISRPDLAFAYYLQAAEAGHSEAQISLFDYYRYGNRQANVEIDLEKAFTWLGKASDNHNARAQFIIGDMHIEGNGVARDVHRGLRWLLLAADKKYPRALSRLGLIYARGEGVSVNHSKGYMYMSLAAEEARGLERPIIIAQHDAMLNAISPEDRLRGLQMAERWREDWRAENRTSW